ncbi:transcription elongation factor NusA-like protein [Natrialba chahannaoensis JCM 10990]|uniref:Probable transcription termination protein NusA n=1 Tax=Natrialba chahannaoensis JCM 10990 TaxID=1227492 RepID=M0B754_9EURY|nr:NusA-like transcription termination signal-binding factor [Natrialba chahannaoensis]ELZ06352.1 transcription elongation factor NusA-like protein [Natrialba chahannaoensis JCM 10990]
MAVTLDDDARQYLATFEEVTGATGIDCVPEERDERDTSSGASAGTDAAHSSGVEHDGGNENTTATGDVESRHSDRLVIVVERGQMGEAIGPEGQTIQQLEDRLGRSIRLVENADDPESFVANAFAPAAVYNVTISENDDTVAYVEVADADRGIAIGSGGRTIETARTLAARHFEIDDIQLI